MLQRLRYGLNRAQYAPSWLASGSAGRRCMIGYHYKTGVTMPTHFDMQLMQSFGIAFGPTCKLRYMAHVDGR